MKPWFIVLAAIVGLVVAGAVEAAAQEDNQTDDSGWNWRWWGFAGVGALVCFLPLVAFIIAIAIGVWMYRDAERRGKEGTLWLLVGLVGHVIGLVIWLIVRPPVLSPEERRARSRGGRRRCIRCGRVIPFDAVLCPYCGHRFPE